MVFKNGPNLASFLFYFRFLHDKYNTNTINDKSVDGVLGTQTCGGRMVGAEKSTELWLHPRLLLGSPMFIDPHPHPTACLVLGLLAHTDTSMRPYYRE